MEGRRGTTRCWSATSCWCGMGTRWSPFRLPWRASKIKPGNAMTASEPGGQIVTHKQRPRLLRKYTARASPFSSSGFSGSSQDWARVAADWSPEVQLIVPDLRGHGRSGILSGAASGIETPPATSSRSSTTWKSATPARAIGISGGGNVLLHMGTRQPERILAMVLVSATPYYHPAQARPIMRRYRQAIPRIATGDPAASASSRGSVQVDALLAGTETFAGSATNDC